MTNVLFTAMFGYNIEQVVGRTVEMLMPEKFREKHEGRVSTYNANPIPRPMGKGMQLWGLRRDGIEFPIEISLRMLERGDESFVVSAIRDVSVQFQTEQELTRAKELAEETLRGKSEFLTVMSHEVRTPLNGVIGAIQMLKESNENADQVELIEMADSSAYSLHILLETILDLSKIEANEYETEISEIDIETLVEGVEYTNSPRALGKGLGIGVRIDPRVPRTFSGDPKNIERILNHLMENAIKFTDKGRVDLRVELTARESEIEAIRFEVKDTGIGIPESMKSRLFDLFSQVDTSTTRRHQGLGLGLRLSQRLTELIGGSSGFDSEEGVGSTFWFTVPLSL